MQSIQGTTITITQGDTLDLKVEILQSDSDERYIPQAGDSVRFAVKSSYDDKDVLIYQDIPIDTLRLRVEAEVTKEKLLARKKPYVYDIQLTRADGTVDTFIKEAEIYSTPEVD